jgi:hypothetical protein
MLMDAYLVKPLIWQILIQTLIYKGTQGAKKIQSHFNWKPNTMA